MEVDNPYHKEILATFLEITGSKSEQEAEHLLEASSWDIERSINLYFMRGARSTQTQRIGDDVVELNNAHQRKGTKKPENQEEDVEMDNEMNVRAPIAPTQGTLIPQSFRQTYQQQNRENARRAASRPNPIFEQFHDHNVTTAGIAENAPIMINALEPEGPAQNGGGGWKTYRYKSEVSAEPSKNYSQPSKSNGFRAVREKKVTDENPIASASGSSFQKDGTAGNRKKDLAALFRPPVEIMFLGDWDKVIKEAGTRKHWLLVNIQSAGEWASQVLNRDIWSLATVREIVRSSFVLWQVYHNSPDGTRVCGYYSVSSFPAIFIVDPRTGELVKELQAPDGVSFLDQLTSFLEQYPDFETRDRSYLCGFNNQLAEVNAVLSPQSKLLSVQKKRKLRPDPDIINSDEIISDETTTIINEEAEQQAKRMRRVVTITDDIPPPPPAVLSTTQTSSTTSPLPQSPIRHFVDPNEWLLAMAQSPPAIHNQPSTSANTTPQPYTITLRLPDSTRRETLTLWPDARIRLIFSFLASLGVDATQHSLVAAFPKRVFSLDDAELTLEQANFSTREMLHVERD